MSAIPFEKLDHSISNSIKETHKDFGLHFQKAHFYLPEYCPFGDFFSFENSASILEQYSQKAPSFYIFGELPEVPESILKKGELKCKQMVVTSRIDYPITETIVTLGPSHLKDLLGLVQIVYPEYFKTKTASLGNYYGIYKDGQLVAVTGERMQMDEFIEVSAVITHPEHTGNGYAKQLVAHTANAIFDQNKIPFLHVSSQNNRAISLYDFLGFTTRKEISIWNLAKK